MARGMLFLLADASAAKVPEIIRRGDPAHIMRTSSLVVAPLGAGTPADIVQDR